MSDWVYFGNEGDSLTRARTSYPVMPCWDYPGGCEIKVADGYKGYGVYARPRPFPGIQFTNETVRERPW